MAPPQTTLPTDPLPNKAIASAVGTIVLTVLRWAVSGNLNVGDEGLVALTGAITTLAVYGVSNWQRYVRRSEPVIRRNPE